MKFKGLTNSVLGTILTLAGCDNYSDFAMNEIEIKGASNIKKLEEGMKFETSDYRLNYRLEVYDERGNLLDLKNLVDDEKVYKVKYGNKIEKKELK